MLFILQNREKEQATPGRICTKLYTNSACVDPPLPHCTTPQKFNTIPDHSASSSSLPPFLHHHYTPLSTSLPVSIPIPTFFFISLFPWAWKKGPATKKHQDGSEKTDYPLFRRKNLSPLPPRLFFQQGVLPKTFEEVSCQTTTHSGKEYRSHHTLPIRRCHGRPKPPHQ